MKKCPKCGCEKFYVTAHVVEEWLVDANGDYIETVGSCIEVAHYPDNEDIWICAECGYDDAGSEFELENDISYFECPQCKKECWSREDINGDEYWWCDDCEQAFNDDGDKVRPDFES